MSLTPSHPRVPARAAPSRWTAPVGLVLTAIFVLPSGARAQAPSLPTGPSAGCPTTASAATAPFLRVFVGGTCTDLSSSFIPSASTPGIWNLATTLHLTDATVDLTAQVKRDPFITFSATTKNAVPGSVPYIFLFGTPVVPGMYTSASSSGGASVSPGDAQNTTVSPGAVYPTYIGGYGTVGPEATNLNVNLGNTSCVATGIATTTCNFGVKNSPFSPTYFDNLEAVLSYSQNDLQSAAAFTGRIDLNTATATTTTPEPGTLSLLATGLVGLGGVLRRKRRLAR